MTWKLAVLCGAILGIGVACSPGGGVPTELPTPDGAYGVGVTWLPEFYATAYYPAQAGTGHGHRRYASWGLLRTLEVDDLPVSAHAEIGAAPVVGAAPWPVVVVGPGGASFVELSTSLAEELASHGYVVITVQPDAEVENGDTAPGSSSGSGDELATEAVRQARQRQLSDAIDLLDAPITAQLVGPVDADRIAVGGHSYGGSAAFNASLSDPRIKAVFDLDGALFEAATSTPTTVPSLVVMATLFTLAGTPVAPNEPPDVALGRATLDLLRGSPRVVAVALRDAEHYDVTDAAAIAPALPESARLGGPIGPAATTHTNTIVLRFLDAALDSPSRLATGAELVTGLPSATADAL